jgi:hypothetical protein
MRSFIIAMTCLFSTQAISASWNFKSNVDLCKSSLKNKKQYTNYFYENYIYEIIINSSYITCLRIDLSKDQKPYPLNSE